MLDEGGFESGEILAGLSTAEGRLGIESFLAHLEGLQGVGFGRDALLEAGDLLPKALRSHRAPGTPAAQCFQVILDRSPFAPSLSQSGLVLG